MGAWGLDLVSCSTALVGHNGGTRERERGMSCGGIVIIPLRSENSGGKEVLEYAGDSLGL